MNFSLTLIFFLLDIFLFTSCICERNDTDKDFRAWNGTIPAITFCYHKRIDIVKAQKLIKRYWNVEAIDSEYEYFMDYVNLVANTSIYSFRQFAQYVNDRRLEFVDMATIAENLIPNVNVNISGFDTNLNPMIVEIMTERGICHTINGILASALFSTKYVYKFHYSSILSFVLFDVRVCAFSFHFFSSFFPIFTFDSEWKPSEWKRKTLI